MGQVFASGRLFIPTSHPSRKAYFSTLYLGEGGRAWELYRWAFIYQTPVYVESRNTTSESQLSRHPANDKRPRTLGLRLSSSASSPSALSSSSSSLFPSSFPSSSSPSTSSSPSSSSSSCLSGRGNMQNMWSFCVPEAKSFEVLGTAQTENVLPRNRTPTSGRHATGGNHSRSKGVGGKRHASRHTPAKRSPTGCKISKTPCEDEQPLHPYSRIHDKPCK